MESRLWILGAPDPEMEAIETLLRECGERVAYAVTTGGERVRGGDAYRAAAVRRADDADGVRQSETWYLVECSIQAPDGVRSVVIDHHRPGDPGYGRPPEDFMAASSIGQVIAELAITRWWREETSEGRVYFPSETPIERAGWRTLPGGSHHDHDSTWGIDEIGEYTEDAYGESGEAFVKEMVEEGGYYHVPHIGWVFVASRGGHELGGCVDAIVIPDRFVFAAAADHCLAAAYRGECPGVDPDELMRWRVASRAQFQRRAPEEVLADVERAREILSYAAHGGPCRVCGGSGRDDEWQCTSCCGRGWEPAHAVSLGDGIRAADLRGVRVAELVEAATRDDVAYVADGLPDHDGRRKTVCSGPADVVRAFLEAWAPAQGLIDLYGDPARGFAGGYAVDQ